MDKVFTIDYNRLVKWLIPVQLRRSFMVAWCQVLVYPVSSLFQAFSRNRRSNLYSLGITPQVCYLEKMLNDRFDLGERRIYINDPERNNALDLYQVAEDKPVYLYTVAEDEPVDLYTDGEAGIVNEDFIVYVPAVLDFNTEEMKALLDLYKLAGKRYKIETF